MLFEGGCLGWISMMPERLISCWLSLTFVTDSFSSIVNLLRHPPNYHHKSTTIHYRRNNLTLLPLLSSKTHNHPAGAITAVDYQPPPSFPPITPFITSLFHLLLLPLLAPSSFLPSLLPFLAPGYSHQATWFGVKLKGVIVQTRLLRWYHSGLGLVWVEAERERENIEREYKERINRERINRERINRERSTSQHS